MIKYSKSRIKAIQSIIYNVFNTILTFLVSICRENGVKEKKVKTMLLQEC